MPFVDSLDTIAAGGGLELAGAAGRREQLRQLKDGELLDELHDRIMAADAAMERQREGTDSERRYHGDHYSDEDYEDAESHEFDPGDGGDSILVPEQPLVTIDMMKGPIEE